MHPSHLLTFFFAFWAMILVTISPALANAWVDGEHSRARIISAQTATGDAEQLSFGVEIKLDQGWKTYWQYPGEAGLPPEMNWESSTNLKSAQALYPVPKRFTLFDIDNFGYANHVTFPVHITQAETGQALSLQLKLNILVCEEICVPEEFAIQYHLPAGLAKPTPEAATIATWLNKVPKTLDFNKSGIRFDASRAKEGLTVYFPNNSPLQVEDIFITSEDGANFGKAELQKDQGYFFPYRGSLYGEDTILDYMTQGNKITLKHLNAPAEEISFPATALTSGKKIADMPVKESYNLLYYVLIAILGGLILNLMPCVLPVLSLKILSLIGHSNSEQKHIRLGFLSSSAGIITGFMILAAILTGLKEAGAAFGWGIQFQNPLFLIFMIALVLLFAFNLWGAFEIPLPRFIANTAHKKHEHEPTMFGHFLTGMLAMLLATPCSAPFLGTAVGFALSQGGHAIFVIFFGLGFGLAIPYLLIALCPRLAHFLPKPGAWMLTLRKVLSIALVVTAIWLGSVLYHVYKPQDEVNIALNDKRITWQIFSPETLKEAIDQGQTVFVDITADWCITCQANKRLTLHQAEVSDLFKEKNIVALQGDWTRADQVITDYLQSYQKYGIPFNIIYGPNAPEGIILPELLTAERVSKAIIEASQKP